MPNELLKCPNCSALLSVGDASGCPYCGATFAAARASAQSEGNVGSPGPSSVRERLARLAGAPEVRAALASEVPVASERSTPLGRVLFGGLVVVLLLVMATQFARHAGAFALFPLGMAAIVVVRTVRLLSREQQIAGASVERSPAALVAKRTQVSGGEHARTTYFVTLEFPDGRRTEFEVDGRQYGLCAEDDLGVAYVQGPALARFLRIDPRA